MAAAPTHAASPAAVWIDRLRIALAAAAVWVLLHYVGGLVLPRGFERPVVLAGSYLGTLGGALIAIVLWVAAALAGAIIGRTPLVPIGLGLALWAAEGGPLGGTMDAWLTLRHLENGSPTGGPYWLLLIDYVYLAAALVGVLVVSRWVARGPRAAGAGALVREALRPHAPPRAGLYGLLITVVVAGAAMYFLTGAPAGRTYRWQVYFAVAVGCMAGVWATRRLAKSEDIRWLWPAPLIVGVVGAVTAGLDPALRLPEAYAQLDTIPAWGLVRPLPVEMVGVGLVALAAMLPPHRYGNEPQRPT